MSPRGPCEQTVDAPPAPKNAVGAVGAGGAIGTAVAAIAVAAFVDSVPAQQWLDAIASTWLPFPAPSK